MVPDTTSDAERVRQMAALIQELGELIRVALRERSNDISTMRNDLKSALTTLDRMEKIVEGQGSQQPLMTRLALYEAGLQSVKVKIEDFTKDLSDKCVQQQEFRPIKALVYGAVGLFLTSIVGSILALVLRGI